MLRVWESGEGWMGAARAAVLAACERAGEVHLCLSGGSTPKPLYEELARSEEFSALAKSRDVHLWVGDEREAAPGSGLRNSEMIGECFVGSPVTFHPWPLGPREAAGPAYAREFSEAMRGRLGACATADVPLFDLVLLGMGEDGHTAGLFSARDLEPKAGSLVVFTEAPSEPRHRQSLTLETLGAAGKVVVFLRGRAKVRRLMENLFGERSDPIGAFLARDCEVLAQL